MPPASCLPFTRGRAAILTALLTLAILTGCKPKNSSTPGSAAGGMPPIPVVVVEAKPQPVSEKLALVGTLTANESIEVKCEIDGTVQQVLFQEGQPVRKGTPLVVLDESKLSAQVAEAEANFKLSETTQLRNQQLRRDNLVSQQEFDTADANYRYNKATLELRRRLLTDARILAPFDGTTGSRLVSPGQVISRNTALTTLVDINPVKAEINVPERFLSRLAQNQVIDLSVAAFPGRLFKGTVFFIAPSVDTATRTTLVKANVPNPDNALKPGMFANLDLTLQVRDNALVIPEPAIAQMVDQDRAIIYIVDAGGIARLNPVQLGIRLPGKVEVVSGLTPGTKVIVEGHQKIGPGSKVIPSAPDRAAAYL